MCRRGFCLYERRIVSARWYKRCGADFIHGTMMLTLEEKGAYSLCLDLIYDRGGPIPDDARWLSGVCGVRSEEHTSELQSQSNLVCRLLLEKKKKKLI